MDTPDSPEPHVSWTAGPAALTTGGYVTTVAIQVESPGEAKSLAILVKAAAPLTEFQLYEAGTDPAGGPAARRLRDGREFIVVTGTLAGLYEARVATAEPSPIEVEAVLDLPF